MTISTSTRKAGPFIGNGVTAAFPFAFKVFAAADLQVVQAVASTGAETPKVLNVDFTVSLNPDQGVNPGGTITMLVAPPAGTTLTATSQMANQQPTKVTNQGGFYPEVINDALDRVTILVQQLAEKQDRTLLFPLSNQGSPTLPVSGARAGRFLAFDAAGDPALASGTGADGALRTDLSALAGAALVAFALTGVGSLQRSVQDKLRETPSVQDYLNQSALQGSALDWFYTPKAAAHTVAGAMTKAYWGPGTPKLVGGAVPGTQGGAKYGFMAMETVAVGGGQHFTLAAKVFTGARTDVGSAPGQNHNVAGYFEAQRGAGSPDGVWALNSVTDAYNLGGPTIGYEIDMNNYSGVDPGLFPGQVFHALSLISGAAGRGTTALVIDRNGDYANNQWHRGLHVKEVFSRAVEFTNNGGATGFWTDAVLAVRGTAPLVDAVMKLVPQNDSTPAAALFYLSNAADSSVKAQWLKRGEINIGDLGATAGPYVGASGFAVKGLANGDTLFFGQRNTDTSPLGSFIRYVNAANTRVFFDVDNNLAAGESNLKISIGGAEAARVYAEPVGSVTAGRKVLTITA